MSYVSIQTYDWIGITGPNAVTQNLCYFQFATYTENPNALVAGVNGVINPIPAVYDVDFPIGFDITYTPTNPITDFDGIMLEI